MDNETVMMWNPSVVVGLLPLYWRADEIELLCQADVEAAEQLLALSFLQYLSCSLLAEASESSGPWTLELSVVNGQ